jgi:PPOX class probable F420-dependent enzyme
MRFSDTIARTRLLSSQHAVLCTLHPDRGVDAVPVCFAVVDDLLVVPIDMIKPKKSPLLQRTRNLELDPRATLLCERWDMADWTKLWWVRASMVRADCTPEQRLALEQKLREKYARYADAPFSEVLVFRIKALSGWSAA